MARSGDLARIGYPDLDCSRLRPRLVPRQVPTSPRAWVVGGAALFIAASLAGLSQLKHEWNDYQRLASAYSGHRYAVVEGTLNNYQCVQGGHGEASFDLDGRHFTYWPASNSPAFHDGSCLGPVQSGVWARIYAVGNDIIRIEIGN